MPTDLELRLAHLEQRLAAVESALALNANPPAPQRVPRPAPTPRSSPINWEKLGSGEGWLGRIGVGLLVVGLILLFRYAVARGWLTPELRIGIGLVVGMGLLISGAALFIERRLYRQILMAGGIIILFITGLAAVEWYHLVRGSIGLLYFIALAVAAFAIAAKQEEPTIASLAAVGALLSPAFLLTRAVPGSLLWLYLAVIVLWTGSLVVLRAWERTTLLAAAAALIATFQPLPRDFNTRLAALTMLAATWLCFAALPLLRSQFKTLRNPTPFRATLLMLLPTAVTLALALTADAHVLRNALMIQHVTAVAAIAFGVIAVFTAARESVIPAGQIVLGARTYIVDTFGAAASAAVVSVAVCAFVGIADPWWAIAVALIASFTLKLAQFADAKVLEPVAHALFLLLVLSFVQSIDAVAIAGPFDAVSVSYGIVALIAAIVAFVLTRDVARLLYLAGVYLAAHVLLATELTAIKAAPWLGSASYAIVGSGLLIAGLATRQQLVQRAGLVSLALLVFRLFLYDLANVDFGVRIVLFMACGFAFLGLSYLVRAPRWQQPTARP